MNSLSHYGARSVRKGCEKHTTDYDALNIDQTSVLSLDDHFGHSCGCQRSAIL